MEAQHYRVLRKISGCDAEPGAVIDCSGWANASLLEQQRYLERAHAPFAPDQARQAGKGKAANA